MILIYNDPFNSVYYFEKAILYGNAIHPTVSVTALL